MTIIMCIGLYVETAAPTLFCFLLISSDNVIYCQIEISIEETLAEYSEQRNTIKFAMEKESHNSINFFTFQYTARES
jgi:hypothetical protein